MAYELKLEKYTGPLDKLLELIEARELEITEISLAQVTDDFLRYLDSIKEQEVAELAGSKDARPDLRILADFIVIASRLVFLKSKSLLPDLELTSEEEADIKDLETRLKLYRELRPAMKIISGLWKNGDLEFSRPYFLNAGIWMLPRLEEGETASDLKIFYPGKEIDPERLRASVSKIFETFEAMAKETQVIKEKIITLEEKINEIIEKVRKISATSFSELSAAQPKGEMIVTFLAILHLAREQFISLEQEGTFSDIMIKKNGEDRTET